MERGEQAASGEDAANNALYYKANYEYTRNGETELSFKEGEILAIYDTSGDWWYGQNGYEEAGWVPPSYLDTDSPIPYEEVYNQYLEDSVHEDDVDSPAVVEAGGAQDMTVAAPPVETLNIATNLNSPGSPGPDTHSTTQSNLDEILQFPVRMPTDDSEQEQKDDIFTSKMNEWCRTTSKVLDETVRESEKLIENPIETSTTEEKMLNETLESDKVAEKPANEDGHANGNYSIGANTAATAEVIETVDIVSDVLVQDLAKSISEENNTTEDIVNRIEATSENVISELMCEDTYDEDEFENDEAPFVVFMEQAQLAVAAAIEKALSRRYMSSKYNVLADSYIQSACSGAVARISERLVNQQFRAAHARQITRTISSPMDPETPTSRKMRSNSLFSHDASSFLEVSELGEAKKRLLSMEDISLTAPRPPAPRDPEEDIFAETENPEPLFSPFVSIEKPVKKPRPKSSGAHLPIKSTIEFDKTLRTPSCSAKTFVKQFLLQRSQRARKNAKEVFEALRTAVPSGENVNISIHDYMAPVIRPSKDRTPHGLDGCGTARITLGKSCSLSKNHNKSFREKKEGMVIIVDPSIDTSDFECTLRVSYGPKFSETETVTIANDGTYCGIELTGAKWNLEPSAPFVPPLSKRSDFDLTKLAASFDSDIPDRSIPGWCGTLPIFVPYSCCKCKLEVRGHEKIDLTQSPLRFYYSNQTTTLSAQGVSMTGTGPVRPRTAPLVPMRPQDRGASNDASLENLSLFCFAASSIEDSLRIVNKRVGSKLKKDVANENAGGGATSLHVAALHGNVEAVRHLVEVAGAAVNVRCKKSSHTPLHEAVIGGHTSIVALLVKNGSNILMKDNTGSLPIHIACASNHVSIVRILINSKAAKKALLTKDGHGKTPRQLCATKFLRTIVEDTMRKMYIFKTCTLVEKGNRGQELFETLAKPMLTRPQTAPVFRPGGPSS